MATNNMAPNGHRNQHNSNNNQWRENNWNYNDHRNQQDNGNFSTRNNTTNYNPFSEHWQTPCEANRQQEIIGKMIQKFTNEMMHI